MRAPVKYGLLVQTLCLIAVLASQPAARGQNTTATITQLFDRPVTSSLPLGTQFFTLRPQDPVTTLPTRSLVLGETSATAGMVTRTAEGTADQPAGNTDSASRSGLASPGTQTSTAIKLPVKVDKTSTVTQAAQLARFEKQNKIGEAFLLACELVRQNPNDDFAYDAAIRTSLVLRLDEDIEKFYREALQRSKYPGKYYTQLAHYYLRNSRIPQLQKLLADYETNAVNSPDYQLTLTRLRTVGEDDQGLKADFETTAPADLKSLPIIFMASRALVLAGETTRPAELLVSASRNDLGSWENRALLMEYLALPVLKPDNVLQLFEAALANEDDYSLARRTADTVLKRTIEARTFHALCSVLRKHSAEGTLNPLRAWLLSLMEKSFGNDTAAIDILTSGTTTPGNNAIVEREKAILLTSVGRGRDALPLLETIVAEQPDDTSMLLLLAEQLLAAGQTTATLQKLSHIRPQKLQPADRIRYSETALSAAIEQQDPAQVVAVWLDIGRYANFEELQASGDVLVRSSKVMELHHRLAGEAEKQLSAGDGYLLHILLARLSSLDGNAQSEVDEYMKYLARAEPDIKMLRFVAELAAQHSSVPLRIEGEDSDSSSPAASVRIRATQAGSVNTSLEIHRKLIDLQPRVAENYLALMRTYQLRGEIESAKKVALEFTDREGSTSVACATAGAMLDESGLTADALAFYRLAVKQSPEDFATWLKYAACLRTAGKYPEAKAIYRRILEKGLNGIPYNQPELFSALLAIATDTGDVDGLVQYLDALRAIEIPGKPEFYLSSAKLLLQVKQPDMAERFLREFQVRHPDSKLLPDSYLLLGQLMYTRGELDAAREAFIKLADNFTSSPAAITAAFNIGEIFRQSGKPREAIDYWLNIASTHPDNDKALSAIYEAALTAHADLSDPALSLDLLKRFQQSGTQDFKLLQKAANSARLVAEGKPLQADQPE